MKILYNEDEGLVIAVSINEPNALIRTAEVLIKAFEDNCDVSFLRAVLITAKSDLQHTLQ